jgi:hypothetical protein
MAALLDSRLIRNTIMQHKNIHIVIREKKRQQPTFAVPYKATVFGIIQNEQDPTVDCLKEYLDSISLTIEPPFQHPPNHSPEPKHNDWVSGHKHATDI